MAYKEGCHPMCPYSEEEKQAVRKELGLTENIIQDDIDAMIEWFEKQPHLIAAGLPDRDFLERMLVNAKGSREKAKKRIDNLYKYRADAPELFQNRETDLDSNRDIWTFYVQVSMPKLFDYKRVNIMKVVDPDVNNFNIEILFKNTMMLGDIRLKYDYMLGEIWILDIKNTSLGLLLRLNPVLFSKASRILDGMGTRIYAIHILGAPSYAQQLIQFFSRFAKQKIIDRISCHDTLDDLYKHVPKQYLPKDYGGEEPSFDFFKEKYSNIIREEETKQFLLGCSKQLSHESLRPGDFIHSYEHLNGSFKKLDLD